MNFDFGVIFNLLQLIGGIILSIGYIPQIAKTVKTKSVEDLSSAYYFNIFIGVGLMEAYALYNVLILGTAKMFLVTNTVAWLLGGTMLFLTLRYRKKVAQ